MSHEWRKAYLWRSENVPQESQVALLLHWKVTFQGLACQKSMKGLSTGFPHGDICSRCCVITPREFDHKNVPILSKTGWIFPSTRRTMCASGRPPVFMPFLSNTSFTVVPLLRTIIVLFNSLSCDKITRVSDHVTVRRRNSYRVYVAIFHGPFRQSGD